jgi:hypothetical protein
MSDESRLIAFGPCWMCKHEFTFDPETVTSIPIDPVTKLPPDLGGDPTRVIKQPLCPGCIRFVNKIRGLVGQPLIPESPA